MKNHSLNTCIWIALYLKVFFLQKALWKLTNAKNILLPGNGHHYLLPVYIGVITWTEKHWWLAKFVFAVILKAVRWQSISFFMITAEICARSLVNFYGHYADRHMNLKFERCVSEREIRQFVIVKNKLIAVFNAPVLLLTMNFVITLSK